MRWRGSPGRGGPPIHRLAVGYDSFGWLGDGLGERTVHRPLGAPEFQATGGV